VKVFSREDLATHQRRARAGVEHVVRRHGESGLRQLLTFIGLFAIVLFVLFGWNAVESLDDPRGRLWGELAFFGMLVWLAIVVLSIIVSTGTSWIVSRPWIKARLPWVRFVQIDPISIPQALAWAAVVMVSIPIAILFRTEGFAILIGATAAAYVASLVITRRFPQVPRLALCYAALVGTGALCLLAVSAREADVEVVTLAPAAKQVPGGAELAAAFRPRLFFDREERFEPVDIRDTRFEGCNKTLFDEGCERTAAGAALDTYEYVKVTGSVLQRGEKPGGADSAYYFHLDRTGDRVYIDYWWYFAHNPAPVAPDLLCGPALKWLGEACAEHPADWEGITLVLVPCPTDRPAPECVSVGGRAFAVEEVRYAQHDKVVRYPWTTLRDRWGGAPRRRPSVYVALSSHASYADRCIAGCKQIVRSTFKERRNGEVVWTNNGTDCGTDCLQPLPVDAARVPSSWNAFTGRWGAQHCILFGSYCDVQRAPRAPSFQDRYRKLDCPRSLCITSKRF
jgi:hypothetical protein